MFRPATVIEMGFGVTDTWSIGPGTTVMDATPVTGPLEAVTMPEPGVVRA
jgi:hypothetical protein